MSLKDLTIGVIMDRIFRRGSFEVELEKCRHLKSRRKRSWEKIVPKKGVERRGFVVQ